MNEERYANLSETTFGNSPAAINLIKILKNKNNRRLISKASKIISQYSAQFALVRKIKISSYREEGQRKYLSQLLYNDVENKLQTMDMDTEVKSYILNILNVQKNKYK